MSISDPDRASFLARLDAVLDLFSQLEQELATERTALARGEVVEVETCNQRKQAVLEQLNSEFDALLALTRKSGHSGDIEGFGQLLCSEASADGAVRNRQKRLEATLRRNQELNQINGYLAFTGQREATALLGLMLRDESVGEGVTYDPSGKTAGPARRGGTSRKA